MVFERCNVITSLSYFLIIPVTLCLGEYIALYQNQRAIMKQRHIEKEEYISRLARDKEEMKVLFLVNLNESIPITWQSVESQFTFMMHVIQIKYMYKKQDVAIISFA